MTRRFRNALAVALGGFLLAAPALAQNPAGLETTGPRGPAPRAELGPSTGSLGAVPAGQPFLGSSAPTEADLRASGAFLTRDAVRPDLPGPRVARELAARTETILGWDARMRFYTDRYPNRAIVYIQYDNRHHCSGAMISRNTVLTAGHCVHTGGPGGSWYNLSLFRVFPGRNGTSTPYGSCTVRQNWSFTGWTNSGSPSFDIGLMRLNCTVGNTTGWFGTYAASSTELANAPSYVIGYPGDGAQLQLGSGDRIRRLETRMVCYRNDTVGGHSGSPVWNDRNQALATNGAWIYAVHAYGLGGSVCGGSAQQMNGGARLLSDIMTTIVNVINTP